MTCYLFNSFVFSSIFGLTSEFDWVFSDQCYLDLHSTSDIQTVKLIFIINKMIKRYSHRIDQENEFKH